MKSSPFIFALFFSASCFAKGGATGAGDGGQGVVCSVWSNTLKRFTYSTQLLDLYEARHFFIIGQLNPDEREISSDFFFKTRIDTILSQRQEAVLEWVSDGSTRNVIMDLIQKAKRFDVVFQIDANLTPTNDQGELTVEIPSKCKVVQIATNYKNSDGRQIVIDESFADYMTDDEIAALLLHEAAHSYFDYKTTEPIRQFVTYLFSGQDFKIRNIREFHDLVSTKLPMRFNR